MSYNQLNPQSNQSSSLQYDPKGINNKDSGCNSGLIAVAVITAVAVIGLLIIAIIAIIWVTNSKKSSSSSQEIQTMMHKKVDNITKMNQKQHFIPPVNSERRISGATKLENLDDVFEKIKGNTPSPIKPKTSHSSSSSSKSISHGDEDYDTDQDDYSDEEGQEEDVYEQDEETTRNTMKNSLHRFKAGDDDSQFSKI